MDSFFASESYELAIARQADERKRLYGVYPAVVKDLNDPESQGRVRIRLPWAPDSDSGYEAWARMATMMAGNHRGTWFLPDIGDEVLVSFEGGDPRRPYILGGLWNGSDSPPETMDSASQNNKKVISSREDIRIIFDDTSGGVTLTIQTPGGQKVILKDTPASIEVTDSSGNTLKMESSGITLQTSSKLTIQASTIDISAGMVKVDSGMSKFSGVVKSDTVITNSVVSSSYTPGAGNIW
jgi:uncharacterized protein involved in type VI secretion and phage assembly